MKKSIQLLTLFVFFAINSMAQALQSPDEFLGYSLGEKYTAHHRIVDYFKQAAAAVPSMMQLKQYGQTPEGRPLLLAFVASAENLSKLDAIQKNNLRLAGLLKDKPADLSAPAIIWLSYNVHGNETSSSEVAMKVLFELLNPLNIQSKEWLKNTVVIIDPCLNPDGRDHYINWFTQVAGKTAVANPDAREHKEPWPGGRTNHYNFDLNRDWAWQVQPETQLRMKVYNQWMPQVHSDYHEQGVDDPYYFAPAAEPIHEVVTPWQKEFQVIVGKRNAASFDKNGWFYFTREEFDLFYPSYGDTYPIYNGAIGMTFEQAGNDAAGLAVIKSDGELLTLKDRIAHHYTTSITTIETVSQNAAKVVAEFKKFFDDASKGVGIYKTYIIKTNGAVNGKVKALKQLLDNNNIRYGVMSKQAAAVGYNYVTGKEESFTINEDDICINNDQPKSVLLKVLFEPVSALPDSVTYDITAWSIPYAFGMQAYALKNRLVSPTRVATTVNSFDMAPVFAELANATTSKFAYLLPMKDFSGSKALAALLQAGVKVRFAEKDFEAAGKSFLKGTLIVTASGNKSIADTLNAIVRRVCLANEILPTIINTGFADKGYDVGSAKIHLIKKPEVALLTGPGVTAEAAGEIWHLFEQQLNYPITLINAIDLNVSMLKNIDVLILPDGNYRFLADKEDNAALKAWVQRGGRVIAMENAVTQLAKGDWGIKLKNEEEIKNNTADSGAKRFENRVRDAVTDKIPGAIYKTILDNSHPLAFGYPDYYFTLKQNTNVYGFSKDIWPIAIIRKQNPIAGFVGTKAKEKIRDGVLIGVAPVGDGAVVFFADDPVFRSFWENGKQLFANAVFLVTE